MGIRIIKDTDKKSEELQIEIFRNMFGQDRFNLSLESTQMAIELIKAGIKQRHSEYSNAEIEDAL
ncbi:MAG: hypothetical protein ACPL28_10165 [bacterium]